MITPVPHHLHRLQQPQALAPPQNAHQSNPNPAPPSIDKIDPFKIIIHNPSPIFIIDSNLVINLASDHAHRLFGPLLGRHLSHLCSPISSDHSIPNLCDLARRELARLKALNPLNEFAPISNSLSSQLPLSWPPLDLLSPQIPSIDVQLSSTFLSHAHPPHPALHHAFLLQIYAFEPSPGSSSDEAWFHCTLRSPDKPRYLSAKEKFIERMEHAISDSPVDWPMHALSTDHTLSIANQSGCQLFQELGLIESYPLDNDPLTPELGTNRGKNGFSTHKWALFDPDFKVEIPRDQFPVERAIRGETLSTNQYGCVLPDGSRRIISIGAKTIRDFGSTGEILGGLIYVNDVTNELEKIKEAEQEKARLKAEALAAADANKSKSAFLSNMSHELRTPIAVIMGLIDLLLDSNLSVQQHDYAETIKASADCLLSVIGDVLDLSKIESGKLTFEASPFDLCQLVSEVERLFSHAAKSKANSLKCILLPAPGQMTRIVGDRGRIRQVLSNLISNSLKFTHRGSVTLAIRLEPRPHAEPGELCLTAEVVDTGIGLTPQSLQTLTQFQPFSQADPSTSRLYGGTGLGLCIVKSLVDGMGGQLCLRSDGLGKGCRATAVMMVKSADERPKQIHAPLTRQPSSLLANDRTSYSILVADDNPIMARITVTLLQKRGFKTDLVVNGQQALERALEKYGASGNRASYDLVIIDLMMPIMDGFQAVKAMRQAMPNVYLPVIALSASAVRGDREKCLGEAKFDEYLTKPIKCDVLEERVVHFLSLVDRAQGTATVPTVVKPCSGALVLTTSVGSESKTAAAVVVVETNEKTRRGVLGTAMANATKDQGISQPPAAPPPVQPPTSPIAINTNHATTTTTTTTTTTPMNNTSVVTKLRPPATHAKS